MKVKDTIHGIGWVLTGFLPLALIASGTVTQGDDDAWRASLFLCAPIIGLGFLLLAVTRKYLASHRWFGAFHISSLILGANILPGYWQRVTLARDHIGAGFNSDYVGSFEPETWHFFWAPVMSLLVLFAMLVNVVAWVQHKSSSRGSSR